MIHHPIPIPALPHQIPNRYLLSPLHTSQNAGIHKNKHTHRPFKISLSIHPNFSPLPSGPNFPTPPPLVGKLKPPCPRCPHRRASSLEMASSPESLPRLVNSSSCHTYIARDSPSFSVAESSMLNAQRMDDYRDINSSLSLLSFSRRMNVRDFLRRRLGCPSVC